MMTHENGHDEPEDTVQETEGEEDRSRGLQGEEESSSEPRQTEEESQDPPGRREEQMQEPEVQDHCQHHQKCFDRVPQTVDRERGGERRRREDRVDGEENRNRKE